MKCLVTGGAGFIGSHLASHLVAGGDEVVVLDDLSTGRFDNIASLSVEAVIGDVRDVECLARAMSGVDVVFHHAAMCSVAGSMDDPVTTHDVNATGTLRVLEACRKAGVRRFVMASSSSVYGDAAELPQHESMKLSPISPYAASKLIGEVYAQLYWKAFGLETVVLRYFNVFGPRQAPDSEYAAVIPKFVSAVLNGENPVIFGDGLQTRDFTYVQNVVLANVAAATSSMAVGQVINVACGKRYSLLDLLTQVCRALDCEVSPRFARQRSGDVMHSRAAIDKAVALLAYSPEVGFEEGLEYTVDWFQSDCPVARGLSA